MPQYGTSGTDSLTVNPTPPTVLYPGDETYLFGTSVAAGVAPTPGISQKPTDANAVFEAVNVGERSIAVALAPRPGGGAAPGMIVQISANANPGAAAEIDIQDSAVDADGAYITPNNATYKITVWTLNGAVYTANAEFQPEGGHFITLMVVANPNAVSFTAKVVYV